MKVPFDHKGNLLHYPIARHPHTISWLDNLEFSCGMKIDRFERGRSSAYFILKNTQGREHPMFLKDMFEMLKVTTVVKGEAFGKWTFVKRGQNYGLSFVS
jgi:hypothetical protein